MNRSQLNAELHDLARKNQQLDEELQAANREKQGWDNKINQLATDRQRINERRSAINTLMKGDAPETEQPAKEPAKQPTNKKAPAKKSKK